MSIGFTLPPSKSQTMRALTFALMANGRSTISNPLFSPDTMALLEAIKLFGSKVEVFPDKIEIESSGNIGVCEDVIQCGNSGIMLRFLGAISGLSKSPIVLTGDYSLRHQRVILPLLDGLKQWGAEAFSLRGEGAPIFIKGPIRTALATVSGEDSQPISGLLIAGAFGDGPFELNVKNVGEKPWIDLTLSWLDRFHISYERWGYEKFFLKGHQKIEGFKYNVPGDVSSSLFPIVASLITQKPISIGNFDKNDLQGDKKCIDMLNDKGAKIFAEDSIVVEGGDKFKGGDIDVNDYIDSIPILAVLACFGENVTRLKGGEIARSKECDRIKVMARELTKMGAKIIEESDGLTIYPSSLKGAKVSSHNDHRVAMALGVASLRASGETVIEGKECVSKSYPHFFEELKKFK